MSHIITTIVIIMIIILIVVGVGLYLYYKYKMNNSPVNTVATQTTQTTQPITQSTNQTTTQPTDKRTVSSTQSVVAANQLDYIGCYIDKQDARALPTRSPINLDITQCQATAQAAGSPYFAMQNPSNPSNGVATIAQCYYGSGDYNIYGPSSGCTIVDNWGNKLGGYLANAVYSA